MKIEKDSVLIFDGAWISNGKWLTTLPLFLQTKPPAWVKSMLSLGQPFKYRDGQIQSCTIGETPDLPAMFKECTEKPSIGTLERTCIILDNGNFPARVYRVQEKPHYLVLVQTAYEDLLIGTATLRANSVITTESSIVMPCSSPKEDITEINGTWYRP